MVWEAGEEVVAARGTGAAAAAAVAAMAAAARGPERAAAEGMRPGPLSCICHPCERISSACLPA